MPDEDVRDAVLQRGQRVAGTGTTAARGGRDVHRLLDQDAGVVFRFELGRAVRERLVDASAGGAHELSGRGLLVLGQRADFTVGQAERGFLPGVGEPHGLELIERRAAAAMAATAWSTAAVMAASSRGFGTAAPGKVSVIYCS